jgi:small-conductance mechanosensitive channel
MDGLQSPIIIATGIVLLAGVGAVALHSRPLWLKVSANAIVLILMTLSLRQVVGSPVSPQYTMGNEQHIWQQMLEATWWVVAARLAITITRLAVVLESRPRETQFLSDLLVGIIYVFTVLAIVNFAFAVHIQGILETSGVIAIVFGLALQSTLSDVFSGIAVGIEKPFKPGDLLWIEGDIEGHVTQINWRSTHVITGQTNIAIIPNSVIAKSKILNRSTPTSVRGDTLTIRLDNRAETTICVETLSAAMKACRLPLAEPAPEVNCSALFADGNEYKLTFYVSSSEFLPAARHEIFSLIQRHLFYEGISFAAPGLTLVSGEKPTLETMLERSELFKILTPPIRQTLAKYFSESTLHVGDKLLERGTVPEAMMIIAGGTAEVSITGSERSGAQYKLSPGDSLGAVGMFTESASHSSAVALTEMKAFRLAKTDIARAVRENDTLAAGLEALARCGQTAIRRDAAISEDTATIHEDIMLDKIRNFFRLLIQSR